MKRTWNVVGCAEVIDEVVRELNDLHRSVTIQYALSVGTIIIDRFYGGDVEAWRSRRSSDVSLRKLALRTNDDLKISASTIYRSLAVLDLWERVPVSIRKQLGLSHFRSVFGLPAEKQIRLLTDAVSEKWTVATLESHAEKVRSTRLRRGRKPMVLLSKVVSQIARLVERSGLSAEAEASGPNLGTDEADGIRRTLADIRRQLD